LKGAHFDHILVRDKSLHLMHIILKPDVKIFQETSTGIMVLSSSY